MFSRLSSWWYGNKTTLKPSLTGDEPATDTKDALSQFNDLLENEKKKIAALRNEWMAHKKDVIGGAGRHPQHTQSFKCQVETQDKVKSVIALFFEKIKGMFQTAKANLKEQIQKEVAEHIKPLQEHIDALCEQANDKTKTEAERRDVVVHICNASIFLLNELEALTSDISDEIAYCLKTEHKEEETAKIAINAGLFLLSGMVGIILPPVDFDFTQEYRNFLSDEIQDPEVSYECELTQAEGELKKADHIVEGYTLSRRGSGGIFSQPTLAPAAETEAPAPITTLMIRPQ